MGLTINGNQWGKGLISNESLMAGSSLENIDAESAASKLSDIAKYAFGTKDSTENAQGGFGRIGIFNGRVVKFATSRTDRLFVKTTDEMRAACDELRTTLSSLAETYLKGLGGRLGDENKFKDKLDTIREQLGLKRSDADKGSAYKEGVGLLDRKVVASILTQLSDVRKSVVDGAWNKYNNKLDDWSYSRDKLERYTNLKSLLGSDQPQRPKTTVDRLDIFISSLKTQKEKDSQILDKAQQECDNVTDAPSISKPQVNDNITGLDSYNNVRVADAKGANQQKAATTEVKQENVADKNQVKEEAKEEMKPVEVRKTETVQLKTSDELKMEEFAGEIRKFTKLHRNGRETEDNPLAGNAYSPEDIKDFLPNSFRLFSNAKDDAAKSAVISKLKVTIDEAFKKLKYPHNLRTQKLADMVEELMRSNIMQP